MRAEIDIPLSVASKLRHYVYLWIDPRTGRPFYVGKGYRRRALDHFADEQQSEKTRILRALKRRGLSPQLEILTHGLDDQSTAYRIESAAIDLLKGGKLANRCRGRGSRAYGRMTIRELNGKYAKGVQIIHPAILIRINKRYRHVMPIQALYEATRGIWRVGRRREGARYAMAVYEGVVREVYTIKAWHRAGSTSYQTRTDVRAAGRWEFTGTPAPSSVRKRYLDRSVESYLASGSQNPIAYVRT